MTNPSIASDLIPYLQAIATSGEDVPLTQVRCQKITEAAEALSQLTREVDELRDTIVGLWHDANSGHGTLHECLGMTWEQYQAWVMNPEALSRSSGDAQ